MKKPFEFKSGEFYTVYADGSSLDNGKPHARGGWAYVILDKEEKYVLQENFAAKHGATNNQMELTAAIEAVEVLPRGAYIHMKLDSQYVINGCRDWLKGWIRKDFSGVKNEGLWRRMIQAQEDKLFSWTWVKGHSVSTYNNRCDVLAQSAAHSLRK